MKKRIACGALAVAVLFSTAPARAEVIDMAAITCGELLNMNADESGTIMVWVHGYFGGMANDTKVDMKAFGEVAKAVGDYCALHKKVTLLSAVKDLTN